VTIKRVGVLSAFQPVYDKIRDRSGDYLVTDLQGVAGEDDVDQGAGRINSAEGQCDNENRVDRLADDGGTDGAGPEPASVGEQLEPRHGVGVGEFAGPEGDEASGQNARDEAEDGGEGLLVMPAWRRWERDDDGSDEIEEGCAEEAQPDGATRGCEAVDLGEDVSEDVGDGEQDDRSADSEWADGPCADGDWTEEADFLSDEVRYEQNDDEGGCKSVEILETESSRWCGTRLDCVELRGHSYQYAVRGCGAPVFDRDWVPC